MFVTKQCLEIRVVDSLLIEFARVATKQVALPNDVADESNFASEELDGFADVEASEIIPIEI